MIRKVQWCTDKLACLYIWWTGVRCRDTSKHQKHWPLVFNYLALLIAMTLHNTSAVADIVWHSDRYQSENGPPTDTENMFAGARQNKRNKPSAQSFQIFRCPRKDNGVLEYPLSAHQRLWSDCTAAQADLSLKPGAYGIYWFCHAWAHVQVAGVIWTFLRRNKTTKSKRWGIDIHVRR